jgi:hypothetical protein
MKLWRMINVALFLLISSTVVSTVSFAEITEPETKKLFFQFKRISCGKTNDVLEFLRRPEFDEKEDSIIGFGGLENKKSIFILYKNEEKKSFSVVQIFTTGYACLLAFGYTEQKSIDSKEKNGKETTGDSI